MDECTERNDVDHTSTRGQLTTLRIVFFLRIDHFVNCDIVVPGRQLRIAKKEQVVHSLAYAMRSQLVFNLKRKN